MHSPEQTNRSLQESNKRFVIEHFEEFVNQKNVDVIERNMSDDFYDQDGPGGRPTDRAGDKAMMSAMHKMFPDLKVEVREAIAESDKVLVRNIWTGTHAETHQRMEFHGFVLWRLKNGKIVERWATVTPPRALTAAQVDW